MKPSTFNRTVRILTLMVVFVLVSVTVMAGSRGSVTASMHVSVTVVEAAHVEQSEPLALSLQGERYGRVGPAVNGSGRIRIPAPEGSEMIFQVSGSNQLSDGNGHSIEFQPDITLGNQVDRRQKVHADGRPASVRITGADEGNYRGVAELQIGGTIDAGQQDSGTFRTVYSITTEHI